MNGKQLRNSILQWAISGRLVPQDSNDEPASALLKRINPKASPLSPDDAPFPLPDGWCWCRLGDIVQINPKNDSPDDTMAAFIPMEKVGATYGSQYTYDEVEWGSIKKGYTHFADGDVAFAKITPCFQNRKSAVFKDLPNGIGAGTTELKVLRPYGETLNRWYLLYFLKSPYFIAEATFKGTANQQRIVKGYLENKMFPLPPLAEQERIVSKVEELLPLVERYDKAQTELDRLNASLKGRLRASILREAISGRLVPQDSNDEPASALLKRINPKFTPQPTDSPLPDSWCWVTGKQICLPMESTKPQGDFTYVDVDAVNNKTNRIDKPKYLSQANAPSRATRKLHGNDVLFSMVRPYLRNIALVTEKYEDAIASTGFYVLTPSKALFPKYLFYMVLSNYVVDGLNAFMKGDNSPSINNKHIEEFLYPLPPLAEQKRIAGKLEELFAVLDTLPS